MNAIQTKNLFFVKEHVGAFKAANSYDILDPETQKVVLECREPELGFFTKILRFTDYKQMTPFNVEVRTPEGELVVRVKRGTTFFFSKVEVFDQNEKLIGVFKQKLSIGGKFSVFGADDNELCQLKGKWTSWDFKFVKNDVEFAHITKKWAGLGKELFTSADNYMLQIDEKIPGDHPLRLLILGAVMCIDMVLKE